MKRKGAWVLGYGRVNQGIEITRSQEMRYKLKSDCPFLGEHPEGGPGRPGGPAAAGLGAV